MPSRLARCSRRRGRRTTRLRGPGETAVARAPSRRHQLSQLLEARRTDTRDGIELVDRAEGAVLLPVVDDLLGGDRPDYRQGVELLERGAVQMHWPARQRAADGSRDDTGAATRHDDL